MDRLTPALVLGSGVTALGVIRSFGRRGVPVLATARAPDVAASSRWHRAAPPMEDSEELAEYLTRLPVEAAVLIPCSDGLAAQTAGLSGALAERFPASVARPETMRALLDKERFACLVREAGVAHPRSFEIRSSGDLAAVPGDVWRSAFLKPRDSQSFFARFGVKAFAVRSPEEAARRLREIKDGGFEVIVQEYVPGPSSNHYFVDGFADRDGRLRAVLARRRLRMFPPDFGNSTYMVTVRPEDAAGAVEGVRRLVEHTRYRGTFSAEFKRDERDGTFRILEMNARPWWYVDFAARCGVDVCRMMYDDALGKEVPDVESYAVGQSLVYPYYDFFACRALLREGRLGLVAWGRQWVTAVQPIWSWDDPMPGVRAVERWLRGWIGRRLLVSSGRGRE